MVEKILGRELADDIFRTAMMSGMPSEKAASDRGGMEKDAFLGELANALKGGAGAASEIPKALGLLALIGSGTGALGAYAYDVIKDNMTREDPEARFNADMEALYQGKLRELEDAKWMSDVRARRDRLRRGLKRMTTEEYAKEYEDLVAALDKKKEIA